ncbi:MAG: hypothetical protein ACRCTZ_19355 [Sarcina sp.]
MGNLIEKTFEKWYRFYKMINNKESFNESESTVAALRINGAIEDYIYDKKQLCEILEDKGIIDNGISERRISYVANERMYVNRTIDLEKGMKNNLEYNRYIFDCVNEIVFENVDIYFEYSKFILAKEDLENIEKTMDEFEENKKLIGKILRVLYLFRNSDKEDTRKKELENYIKFSIVNVDDYFSIEDIDKVLKELEKKELIHLDWSGNYSVISEAKKRMSEVLNVMYKQVTVDEKNEYIQAMIAEKIKMIVEYIGNEEVRVNIDIDGNKIYQTNSDFILKIDNYQKENRDIRRGYYVLNTKQYKNIVFWYGKRILDLDERVKHIIAFSRAIESLEMSWEKDDEKMNFIKEQKEVYERLLNDIKADIEEGFKHGGLIYNGEDKKIEYNDSVVSLFKELINIF